jgi:hypothetical protein
MQAGCGNLVQATGNIRAQAAKSGLWSSTVHHSSGTGDLLYISDGGAYVYIYSYPAVTYVGKIEILNYPSGLCTDATGNVFVTLNLGFISGNGQIVEYPHGGMRPIATLYFPNSRPLGCAVDGLTGNLAVTSYAGPSPSGSGSVAIFRKASGNPRVYTDAKLFFYDFCTYDSMGNLFVDGQDDYLNPVIAELPRGAKRFKNLTVQGLPKTFGYPGDVLWDGKFLAFGDLDKSIVYRLGLSASSVTVVSSAKLVQGQGVAQFTLSNYGKRVHGNTLIGPNSRDRSVMFWSYPAGGKPTKSVTGLDGAFGTAISVGSAR